MEKHHKVRISDAAIVAAVQLSHRYIPARQLPDKAVSLLDTACARVAISQSATPAMIEDTRVAIAAREKEKAALVSDSDLGVADEERIAEIDAEIASLKEKLAQPRDANGAPSRSSSAKSAACARSCRARTGRGESQSAEAADAAPISEAGARTNGRANAEEARKTLREKFDALEAIDPETRMIYAHVDEQAVASVVSDWTGIPVGRMVKDEVETILGLADILNRRVIGQSHGLKMIAKRIETNRAKLDNPNKPIGVFMLCGPSGVGKTETALALAESLYGGEQNMITINMSEFQEAHTVSTLKGAPPGYVGYGEGGRLTEAVRRKPYSVILLDEVEKAHPDVHEIFFQVFDKGQMEDGTGRRIDFKNTLIILTSNVGTDMIMAAGARPGLRQRCRGAGCRAEARAAASVFPAALLGRIVTIPYYPALRTRCSAASCACSSTASASASARTTTPPSSTTTRWCEHIVSLCNDPDSGGRMIDNIITNTLLPALSREFLTRSLAKEELKEARVTIENGGFAYGWGGGGGSSAKSTPPAAAVAPGLWEVADASQEPAPA